MAHDLHAAQFGIVLAKFLFERKEMKVIFYKTKQAAGYTHKLLDTLLSVVADEQVHIACDKESFVGVLLKYCIEEPTTLAVL